MQKTNFKKYYDNEAAAIDGKKFKDMYNNSAYVQNILLKYKTECLHSIASCDSFLDVGCADGYFIKLIQKSFGSSTRCVGIDISEKYIKTAKQDILGAEFICADAADALRGFADNSFDVVLCSEVLEHLVNPSLVFHELLRVAKNTLIITTPRRSIVRFISDSFGYHKDRFKYQGGHISEVSCKDISKWLDGQGRIARFIWDGYVPNGIVRLLRLPTFFVQLVNKAFRHIPYLNWNFPIVQMYVIQKIPAQKKKEKVFVCGLYIDNVSMKEAIEKIEAHIKQRDSVYVVTPNLDHIAKLQHDNEFKRIYNEATLVLADGMPLLWASHFFGTPLKEKVSGSDLFPSLCERAAEKGYRLFFLGGREGAAAQAAHLLKIRYPSIQVVGVYAPPLEFEHDAAENVKIVQMIKKAQPDILFVGLGAPKQEKWIYQYKDACAVPVSIGIGVSFEFVAGMVKRAPRWMQGAGLEWFWRLLVEPGRLWKRYLIDDMIFFWLVLKQKIRGQ